MTLEERLSELEKQVEVLLELAKHNPRRSFMTDKIRWRLVKDLPELQRLHPEGVTSQHVEAFYGVPRASTLIALRWLADKGRILRTKLPGQQFWAITLPGQPLPCGPKLSKRQRRVLEGMRQLAQNGRIEASLSRLAIEIGTNANSLLYVIHCLTREGHVRLVKRGEAGRPNVYFIPSAVNYTEADARADLVLRRNTAAVWADA